MGIKKQIEVEVKFAVDQDTVLPPLGAAEYVVRTDPAVVHHLSAVYYDTDDLRLSQAKIALRRRTGGKDEGWHIKLPGVNGRIELQHPLNPELSPEEDTVPEELMSVIRVLVRNRPLKPIARVDNERHEVIAYGIDDEPVAEFCDDHVSSWSYLPEGTEQHWREWEIEATAHAQETGVAEPLMRSAIGLLTQAGAVVSTSPSKLVMALGESSQNAAPGFAVAQLDEDSPAFAVLQALKRNRDKLIEYDPKVRRDEFDSVHQMRVATRELRSHMQTFEGILVGEKYIALEDHLKQLAGILGQARDAEVIAERFEKLLELDEAEVLDEQTKNHLHNDMKRQYELAHRRVVKTLDNPQYIQLLDDLDEVLANPPLAEELPEEVQEEAQAAELEAPSDQPEAAAEAGAKEEHKHLTPEEILLTHVETAFKKLKRRHDFAKAGWTDPELTLHQKEERVHDIRKAAKKLRYSAEAVGDATSLDTAKIYKACKWMQEVLGDFQDAVTSRDKLLHFAESARRAGEDTFGYGVVYNIEHQLGLEALEKYDESYEKVASSYKALMKKAAKLSKK